MNLKDELTQELESTRQDFHHLLDSIPEAFYSHPSGNPAWTIGDVLYHITLGPPVLRLEIWMLCHIPGMFQLGMNRLTSRMFNWINAPFARWRGTVTRQNLIKAYEKGHAGILSSLKGMRAEDFDKSITYPVEFVSELAGEVTPERLYRYVKGHFEVHEGQIRQKFAGISED